MIFANDDIETEHFADTRQLFFSRRIFFVSDIGWTHNVNICYVCPISGNLYNLTLDLIARVRPKLSLI